MTGGVGRLLGAADGMRLYEARCLVDDPGWLDPVPESAFRIVLSRSGAYLSRINGRESFVDAMSVLLVRPGDELSVAHPLGAGDVFTGLEVRAEVIAERPDGQVWLTRTGWEGWVDDRLDLRHRQLVTACRRGVDALELAERIQDLMSGVLAAAGPDRGDPAEAARRRPATRAAHRRLADRVCEVLATAGFGLGLHDVARAVNCSPHHLSRVFHAVTGQTLTGYRNRLRVRAVLCDLQEGTPNLRDLAARYGFADQAHLTRVIRQHLGQSPATLRRALSV